MFQSIIKKNVNQIRDVQSIIKKYESKQGSFIDWGGEIDNSHND